LPLRTVSTKSMRAAKRTTTSTRSDVLTPAQRSFCMSQNKGRNTSPELRLRKECWALGLRYRLHPALPGRPDLAFPKARLVVFIDGCFWHGCPLHYQAPKSQSDFWAGKRRANAERDRRAEEALEANGWRVMRVWEHDLRNPLAVAVAACDIHTTMLSCR